MKYRLNLLVHGVSHLTSKVTSGGQTDIALKPPQQYVAMVLSQM